MALLLAGLGFLLSQRLRQEEDASWEKVKARGTLRVGLDPSFPPFAMVGAEGELKGYDVNLAREIAHRLGLEAEFIASGFDGLYDALRADRFDCIVSALPYDPALARDYGYSKPYFNAGFVLVVSASSPEEPSITAKPRVLGAERGSEGETLARKMLSERSGGGTLRLYSQPQEVLEAVARGEVAAGVLDQVSAREALAQGERVAILAPPLTQEDLVIAVRGEDRALLARINGILEELEGEGLLGRLEAFFRE